MDRDAEESVKATIEQLIKAIRTTSEDFSGKDSMDIAAAKEAYIAIQGMHYAGVLEIPELNLVLPVVSDCTSENLESSPCRYAGTASGNDLVNTGHNYTAHFGKIHSMTAEDTVCFTDAYGLTYHYEVALMEVLRPYEVLIMTAGGYPLTLFTCTYGGQNRVAVRCLAKTESNSSKIMKNTPDPREDPVCFGLGAIEKKKKLQSDGWRY